VPADEISRRHALVKPTPEGLAVEDLGSSNGTFINGKRVQHGFLNPGDELRLDAVRFILVAPGMEMATAQMPKSNTPAPSSSRAGAPPNYMKWAMIMMVAAVLIMVVVLVLKK
jgi:pSer/pThr/pTyr-binding forkhead associated (FHA) protein